MDWVKLATRYYLDPKIVGLDADAEVLFIRGLAYAGDQETKGFIPDAVVSSLARRRRHAAAATALVEAGLWKHAPGGYRMPAWAHWQEQLDVLAARRAADRDRKRRKRAEVSATSLTSNVRGKSADVRALEEELEQVKGGMSTHEARGTSPPPRKCPTHADQDHPPPCGACRDARLAFDAWHAASRNGAGSPPRPPEFTPAPFLDIETDGKGPAAARNAFNRRHHETEP